MRGESLTRREAKGKQERKAREMQQSGEHLCLGNGNPSHPEWFPLPSFLHPVLYALTVLPSSHGVKQKTVRVLNIVSAIKLGGTGLFAMLRKSMID